MLRNDGLEFNDAVRRVRGDRKPPLVGDLACLPEKIDAAGIDLARHEQAVNAALCTAVMAIDEVERRLEVLFPSLIVSNPFQASLNIADPSPAIVA